MTSNTTRLKFESLSILLLCDYHYLQATEASTSIGFSTVALVGLMPDIPLSAIAFELVHCIQAIGNGRFLFELVHCIQICFFLSSSWSTAYKPSAMVRFCSVVFELVHGIQIFVLFSSSWSTAYRPSALVCLFSRVERHDLNLTAEYRSQTNDSALGTRLPNCFLHCINS